jgi:hypothetical protein
MTPHFSLLSWAWRFVRPLVPVFLKALSEKGQNVKKLNPTRALLVGAAALSFTAASASAANVGGDLYRNNINERRIAELHPPLRPKVRAIIKDLEGHKDQDGNPLKPIILEAWRSPTRQRQLLKRRVTTVTWGFHCAVTPTGKPDALAADIVSFPQFWDAPRPFWMKLAAYADAHNLGTGARWFGKKKTSARDLANFNKALANRNWNYQGRVGWDLPHVQANGVSIAQARAGKRPVFK